jgi:hypothetical protein
MNPICSEQNLKLLEDKSARVPETKVVDNFQPTTLLFGDLKFSERIWRKMHCSVQVQEYSV